MKSLTMDDDKLEVEAEYSLRQVALYACLSFTVVSLLGLLLYITCTKRYRLNWFEKNLLETANESGQLNESHEALVGPSIPYNVDTLDTASIRSLNNRSPTSLNDDPTFWVPKGQRQSTGCPSETCAGASADESQPATPTSPTGSHNSMALSISSANAASNVATSSRTDKQALLAISPARPKVASMQAKLDHTKIDTSLYDNAAVDLNPNEVEDPRGRVHLAIKYDITAGNLTVRLIEAQDLQPRDFSGTADPYAKVRLLPDRSNVWQTRIHKRTLNPVFDEDFVFEERPSIISRRTIEILLYDFDAYSRHVCIGGTQIDLGQIDLSERVQLWKPLASCSEQNTKTDLGDLMVSMSLLSTAERLNILLIKARNLRVVDDTRNASDPYVKVSIIHGGRKIKKRKSNVYRNTVSPTFNEALVFDISKDTLKNSIIEFVVMHDSLLGSNEILGRALVGNSPSVNVDERAYFDEVLRNKTATAQWISLSEVPTPFAAP